MVITFFLHGMPHVQLLRVEKGVSLPRNYELKQYFLPSKFKRRRYSPLCDI